MRSSRSFRMSRSSFRSGTSIIGNTTSLTISTSCTILFPRKGPSLRRGSGIRFDDLANVRRVYHDEVFDHWWLREQVETFAARLLGVYSTVTFAEVDEIIALDPDVHADGNLLRWIDSWYPSELPGALCNGYEIIHRYDQEPAYDPARGVLKDRNWWYGANLYSKPLIWKKAPHWVAGFHHGLTPDPKHPDQEKIYKPLAEHGLLLLHLHRFDYGVAAARLAKTAARFTGRIRGGHQNRLQGEDELKDWWYSSIDLSPYGTPPYYPAPLVEIPEHIKTII